MSAGDAASPVARANRAGRLAACGVEVAVFELAIAGALAGRGFGSGTPPAESAARATTRVPAASRTVKDRVGARMVKSRPVRPPSDIYSLDKIDEELTGGPLPLTAAKRRRRRILGAFFAGAFPVTMAVERGRGARPHAPSDFRGWCHDCQDELQGLVYRARHPLQQRLARRESFSWTGGLADRRGHQWPCPGRDHRREPDADAPGARPDRRVVCRTGERSRAGDRGRGLELYPGGHCACPPRTALRSRRGPGGDAVL